MFKETVIAVHWICRLFWKVFPITSYPIAEINQNSIRIVNQHKGAFPNERLLKQVSRESVYWLLNFLTSHQFKKEKLHFFLKFSVICMFFAHLFVCFYILFLKQFQTFLNRDNNYEPFPLLRYITRGIKWALATGSTDWRGGSTHLTTHNNAAGDVPFCRLRAHSGLRSRHFLLRFLMLGIWWGLFDGGWFCSLFAEIWIVLGQSKLLTFDVFKNVMKVYFKVNVVHLTWVLLHFIKLLKQILVNTFNHYHFFQTNIQCNFISYVVNLMIWVWFCILGVWVLFCYE